MQSPGAWRAHGLRNWTRGNTPRARLRSFPTILAVLALFAWLSSGCAPHAIVIPDPTIPHEVAEELEAIVWLHAPDGYVKTRIRVLPGYWVAGPEVVGRPARSVK